jgi:hypothetical protein
LDIGNQYESPIPGAVKCLAFLASRLLTPLTVNSAGSRVVSRRSVEFEDKLCGIPHVRTMVDDLGAYLTRISTESKGSSACMDSSSKIIKNERKRKISTVFRLTQVF